MTRFVIAMAVLITGLMSVGWVGASNSPIDESAHGIGADAANQIPRYLTVGDQSPIVVPLARRP